MVPPPLEASAAARSLWSVARLSLQLQNRPTVIFLFINLLKISLMQSIKAKCLKMKMLTEIFTISKSVTYFS